VSGVDQDCAKLRTCSKPG